MEQEVRAVSIETSPLLYKMLPRPTLPGVRIHKLTDRRDVSEP